MLKENGVKIVAPNIWKLVKHDDSNFNEDSIVSSRYADSVKEHFDIVTWT